MTHTNTPSSLEMRWVEVADTDGRTRMEARWILVDEAGARAHAA